MAVPQQKRKLIAREENFRNFMGKAHQSFWVVNNTGIMCIFISAVNQTVFCTFSTLITGRENLYKDWMVLAAHGRHGSRISSIR
ncbi:hypothetical protein [Novacetimonas maltaceti]|uniref:hypothetical protein n=1 Tax=Novacetimonas maltaceti TaxID=1203393 RepID=UPI0011AF58A2|nr:hypothetical protein [Novacetimonas maltaceti]